LERKERNLGEGKTQERDEEDRGGQKRRGEEIKTADNGVYVPACAFAFFRERMKIFGNLRVRKSGGGESGGPLLWRLCVGMRMCVYMGYV
jgi:hypothetical protein